MPDSPLLHLGEPTYGAVLTMPVVLMVLLVLRVTHRQRAERAVLAVFLSAMPLALGPVLGGWLIERASWRWVFAINLPLAALTLLLLYRHVPESRDESAPRRLDWTGAGLATFGLAAIVYGLIRAGALGLGHPLVLGALCAGSLLLALFVAVEARSSAPMMPLALFRSRAFAGANLLTLFLYGALGGSLYFVPFLLQQVQGYSPTAAGAAFLPLTAIIFALSRPAGGLVRRFGARLLLTIGSLVTAAGFALFAVPGIGGSYFTTYFPAVVVMSLGMVLVITPLTTTVMNAVDTRHAGVASGVNNAVSRAAGLLAIAVLGLVVTGVFNASLSRRLDALNVPPPVREAISGQRSRLGAAQVPAETALEWKVRLHGAIQESFVAGFRTSMLLAAGLALCSALAAAALLPSRQHPRA